MVVLMMSSFQNSQENYSLIISLMGTILVAMAPQIFQYGGLQMACGILKRLPPSSGGLLVIHPAMAIITATE